MPPNAVQLSGNDYVMREFLLDDGNGCAHRVRSMLTLAELEECHRLAALDPSQTIVDLGALTGAETHAFCTGLRSAGADPGRAAVHSYDFFTPEGVEDHQAVFGDSLAAEGLMDTFVRVNRAHLDMIRIHPGDVLKARWSAGEIGIIFNDIAKTPATNAHLMKAFVPHLRRGGYLMQQDFLNWKEYWVALSMFEFRNCFEVVGFLSGSTVTFRLTDAFPEKWSPSTPSPDLIKSSMAHWLSVAPEDAHALVRITHAHGMMAVGADPIPIVADVAMPVDPIWAIMARSGLERARRA